MSAKEPEIANSRDEMLDGLIRTIRRRTPPDGAWQDAHERLRARFPKPKGTGRSVLWRTLLAAAHAAWSSRRARLATVSLGATMVLALLLSVALFLGSPRAALAQAIQQSIEKALASSFHAITYRFDREKNATPLADAYYQDSRLVEYRQGKAVLFNDGETTWQLGAEPVTTLRQTPQDILLVRTGFRGDIGTELRAADQNRGMTTIAREPNGVLDGRAVQVWKITTHGYGKNPEVFSVCEYMADSETGRLLQVTIWDKDWNRPESKELLLLQRIVLRYDEPIDASVFAVELPPTEKTRDLNLAQQRFAAPGIRVLNRPEVQVELKNCLIGPRGELVACQVVRSANGAPPAYVPIDVRSSCRPYSMYTRVILAATPAGAGESLLWQCWFPEDLDTYLSGSARLQDNAAATTFTVTCTSPKQRGQDIEFNETFTTHPQGEFSEDDFREKVADVIYAAGSTSGPQSYSDLKEKTAGYGFYWSCLGGLSSVRRDPEPPLQWLLHYGDVARANGHLDRALKALDEPEPRLADAAAKGRRLPGLQIVDAQHWIEGEWQAGRTVTFEDVRQQFPDLLQPPLKLPAGKEPLAILGEGTRQVAILDAFRGPSDEIVLGYATADPEGGNVSLSCFEEKRWQPVATAYAEGGIAWSVSVSTADLSQTSDEYRRSGEGKPSNNVRLVFYGGGRLGGSYPISFPVATRTEAEMDKWLQGLKPKNAAYFPATYSQLHERLIETRLTDTYAVTPRETALHIRFGDRDALWRELGESVRRNNDAQAVIEGIQQNITNMVRNMKRSGDRAVELQNYEQFQRDLDRFKAGQGK